MQVYVNRNAFSFEVKETIHVTFLISNLRELKNLGPWNGEKTLLY